MQTIVLIEDNDAIREAVSAYLKVDDFNVVDFPSCEGVVDYINSIKVDLVLADVTLPDGNGFLLVKEIRKNCNTPIIFLTSRTEESDRILGFELGCDDYIQKPFSHRELILRIKAVLKRYNSNETSSLGTVLYQVWEKGESTLSLDSEGHKLKLDDYIINFTLTEWKVLTYLILNHEVVLSREQILNNSLDYGVEGYDRIVDSHIKNIRSKLGKVVWIETVRGYGYKFTGKKCTLTRLKI